MSSSPSVRTHVTFQTARFNQTEVKPHFINEICFGEDCAAWLVGELRKNGFPDLPDPWQEDWGWQTDGAQPPRKYQLSFGLIPEHNPEWLVSIDENVGLLARLKGSLGPPVAIALAPAIHGILSSQADIHAIRWHFDKDFMAGTSDGALTPTG